MINKTFIIFFGFSVLVLNLLQISSAPSSFQLAEDGNKQSSSQEFVDNRKKMAAFLLKTLESNMKLLLERKEIKELLGEQLELLENNSKLVINLAKFSGAEILVRYYLRKYPESSDLLESAVNIWSKAIDDLLSDETDEISSKGTHDKFKNAKNLDDTLFIFEITDEVLKSKDIELQGDNYDALVTSIFMKFITNYYVFAPITSEQEGHLFRKISSLFGSGIFDDICDTLGDDVLHYLFLVMSPKYSCNAKILLNSDALTAKKL